MYPVLLRIGNVPVETYYVFWFVALSLALHWVVGRFPLYGVDDDEGRRVVGWSFIGMLAGSRAFEYVWNFSVYWNNPSLIFDLNRGGLAEVGALIGAMATAALLCRRNPKISFTRLCAIAVPPGFLAIALGRFGCFFAGCCVGVRSSFFLAIRFPYDPVNVTRHPTQLYYSLFAAAILIVILIVEKQLLRRGARGPSLIASLGFLLFSFMRLSIDVFRHETGGGGLTLSRAALIVALPFATLWLGMSWRALYKSE